MHELHAILHEWNRSASTPGCVLATVLHVEGSAYRRPGARMWIRPDGSRIGSISGGCLEGEVVRKAAWWTLNGDPVLRVYDTSSDDDAVWAFGLGCNGVIYVLLERADTSETRELLSFLDDGRRTGREDVVATIVRARPGSPFRTGQHFFSPANMPAAWAASAHSALARRQSRLLHLDGADVFLEYIGPPQRLVVIGAGHDVIPVVSAAASLGWSVTVADVRSGYAKPERFPGAQSVIAIPPSGSISGLAIDRDTAVVVMTHNFPLDEKLLPQILPSQPRYLGLLGPRKRTTRLFASIGEDPACFDLHAPVGLDIGGDTPESIAISIVAEVQAVLSGRSGRSLRWVSGSIHNSVDVVGVPASLGDLHAAVAACEVVYG